MYAIENSNRNLALSIKATPGDAPASTAQSKGLMITRNDKPITILLVDDDPDCRMLIRDAIAECKVSNPVLRRSNGARGAGVPEPPRASTPTRRGRG